jgi:hypothetical protein
MIGIYKITCKETGKCYIGQSINIKRRFKQHNKKFPEDKFIYEILLECDRQYLNFFEKSFVIGYESFLNGFNLTSGGSNPINKYVSESTRQNMKIAAKKRGISKETKNKMFQNRKWF